MGLCSSHALHASVTTRRSHGCAVRSGRDASSPPDAADVANPCPIPASVVRYPPSVAIHKRFTGVGSPVQQEFKKRQGGERTSAGQRPASSRAARSLSEETTRMGVQGAGKYRSHDLQGPGERLGHNLRLPPLCPTRQRKLPADPPPPRDAPGQPGGSAQRESRNWNVRESRRLSRERERERGGGGPRCDWRPRGRGEKYRPLS